MLFFDLWVVRYFCYSHECSTTGVGEYPFTLLATIMNSEKEMIECAKHSKLKNEIEYEGIQEHLEMALNQEELVHFLLTNQNTTQPKA